MAQEAAEAAAAAAAEAAAHKVMSQFKRQRLSVTDYADIGQEILQAGRTLKPQLFPKRYTPLPDVVDWEFQND